MTANGAQIIGIKKFTVTSSNFFTCDRWSADVALDGTPSGYGAPFWALEANVDVQLMASLTGAGALTTQIGGAVDKIKISLDKQMLTVEGRDYSAPLLDTLMNDKLVNQTSSQVATLLATRNGLVPQVTETATQVGRFLNDNYDFGVEDVSEFRVLSFLAQQEGFDFYMTGKTMVFGPPVPDANPLTVTYTYADPQDPRIQMNAPTLEMMQDKTLAAFVTVQVRSWSYQNKAPIIATWQSQKTQAQLKTSRKLAVPSMTFTKAETQGGANAKGPFYIVRRSGLTQAQADALAKKTLMDITTNERSVEYSGPGILNLTARRMLTLTGTRTAFDQTYEIGEAETEFSWDAGCRMTIHAKASSPQQVRSL